MGFFSDLGRGISSFCSSIGTSVGGLVGGIARTLAPVLAKIHPVLGLVLEVVNVVMVLVDIFKTGENVEDVGDRAMQAGEAGIKPENYETFNEYFEEIRNFDLDPEKSKLNSVEVKTIAGLSVSGKLIAEKFNSSDVVMADLLSVVAMKPEYFTAERMSGMLKAGVDLSEVKSYFENKSSPSAFEKTEKAMLSSEKAVNPELSESEFYKGLDDVRKS